MVAEMEACAPGPGVGVGMLTVARLPLMATCMSASVIWVVLERLLGRLPACRRQHHCVGGARHQCGDPAPN
jgi:hypothetical protein